MAPQASWRVPSLRVSARQRVQLGLVVRRDHVLVAGERVPVEQALVEIEDAGSLVAKSRSCGKIHVW